MPLDQINVIKELEESYQPLSLFEFTFKSGNVLRLSTHPLSALYGGTPTAGSYELGGHPWYPRIVNQDVGATQAMSDLGIDIPPQASVVIADPDKSIYKNWEILEGFKGAILKIYVTMWDIGDTSTGSFAANSPPPIKFIGTCSSPSYDDRSLTVVATSLLNMTSMQIPPVRIQPLCGWSFPINLADRISGLAGGDSRFKECAYSPDLVGGSGNYQSGTACFTSCDYSFAACVDRLGNPSPSSGFVPIEQDKLGHPTGRFGGYQWIPNQNSALQRPYLTGKWEEIVNATNEARYGDFVPMCYGLTWVEPLVMGVYGDGNYSHFEVLICYGFVNQIIKVVVNGVEVQHYGYGAGMGVNDLDVDVGHRPDDDQIPSPSNTDVWKNNYWKTINRGLRNSTPSPDIGWGRKGDPYGSVCAIHIQCLRDLAPESSIPTVQILLQGAAVRTYADPSTFTDNSVAGAGNPAWVLMDVLTWANWQYSDMDIQSFIDAAAKCKEQIYFNRMDGTYSNVYNEGGTLGSINYSRYSTGFCIRQRTSIGEIIRGIRNAMKGMLYFDYESGKLRLVIKETLASQQPTLIDGSNVYASTPSVTVKGVDANGYVAYAFDHTNIIKEGNKSSLQIYQKTNQDAPNKVTISFQNRENHFSQDSATIVDAEDVSRLGQEIFGSFSLVGPQTYDHIRRVVNTWFAENYRGNPRYDYEGSWIGDTGGTIMYQLQTTIRGVHLMVGQICSISDQQSGTDNQLARIIKIQPTINFETFQITLQFHNDNWYQDTYGQVNQPKYARPRSMVNRKPYAWRPSTNPVYPFDAYYPQTRLGFSTLLGYNKDPKNNTFTSYLKVAGILPENSFPDTPGRPLLEVAGIGFSGPNGGFQAGKSYYVGIVSKTSTAAFGSGRETPCSALSVPAVVQLTAPNNSLFVNVLNWPDSPTGYMAFVGDNPNTMTFVQEASANPFGIQITGIGWGAAAPESEWSNAYPTSGIAADAMVGPPDEAFSMLRFRTRSVHMPGIFVARAISATLIDGVAGDASQGVTHLKLQMPDGVSFVSDIFAGREMSKYGFEVVPEDTSGQNPLDLDDFTPGTFEVLGNSGDTIYLQGDLAGVARGRGDADPDSATISYYYDTVKWRNIGYANKYPYAPIDSLVQAPTYDNIFVMRILPTFGWDTHGHYIEDALLANPLNPLYQPAKVVAATNASPIQITVSFQSGTCNYGPGFSVVLVGVLGNVAANGHHYISNVNAAGTTATFTLDGTTGSGAYAGGGLLYLQNNGPDTNSLAGKTLFVVAGTGEGTSAQIKSNTQSRIYIQGAWAVPPDSTTRVIVVDSDYLSDVETPHLAIGEESILSDKVSFTLDTTQYPKNKGLLIRGAVVSTNGSQSQESHDPFVERYCFNRFVFDGSIQLAVPGIVKVGTNLAKVSLPGNSVYPVRILAQVSEPPDGADLVLNVRSGGVLVATISIFDGLDSGVVDLVNAVGLEVVSTPNIYISGTYDYTYVPRKPAGNIVPWTVLLGNDVLSLDVVSVGSSFEGKDLSVTVSYNFS